MDVIHELSKRGLRIDAAFAFDGASKPNDASESSAVSITQVELGL